MSLDYKEKNPTECLNKYSHVATQMIADKKRPQSRPFLQLELFEFDFTKID
jgi:hypothetical protein